MPREVLIVVVDRDVNIGKQLGCLLKSNQFEIQTFPSAAALLKAKLPKQPACVVAELESGNVQELKRTLDRGEGEPEIIYMSRKPKVTDVAQAMKSGAVDFLEKPLNSKALDRAIRSAVQQATQRRSENIRRREIESRFESLTAREQEVFTYVISGWLNKQIARKLGVCEKTVKVHRGRVMAKMQARSLADLVRLATIVAVEPMAPPSV